jgi:hypothetical protein
MKQSAKMINYQVLWNRILKDASKSKATNYYGAFVSYDDTPRRGEKAKIVLNSTPALFYKNMKTLIKLAMLNNKEYIFLTAWNEWGEGACLEPDTNNKYAYLEALHKALSETGNL